MADFMRLANATQETLNLYFSQAEQAHEHRVLERESAIKIQKFWRGHRTRKNIQYLHTQATQIQRVWRGYVGRQIAKYKNNTLQLELERKFYDRMATQIKRVWRGYASRRCNGVPRRNLAMRKILLRESMEKGEELRQTISAYNDELNSFLSEEKGRQEAQQLRTLSHSLHHLTSTKAIPGVYVSAHGEEYDKKIKGVSVDKTLRAARGDIAIEQRKQASLLRKTLRNQQTSSLSNSLHISTLTPLMLMTNSVSSSSLNSEQSKSFPKSTFEPSGLVLPQIRGAVAALSHHSTPVMKGSAAPSAPATPFGSTSKLEPAVLKPLPKASPRNRPPSVRNSNNNQHAAPLLTQTAPEKKVPSFKPNPDHIPSGFGVTITDDVQCEMYDEEEDDSVLLVRVRGGAGNNTKSYLVSKNTDQNIVFTMPDSGAVSAHTAHANALAAHVALERIQNGQLLDSHANAQQDQHNDDYTIDQRFTDEAELNIRVTGSDGLSSASSSPLSSNAPVPSVSRSAGSTPRSGRPMSRAKRGSIADGDEISNIINSGNSSRDSSPKASNLPYSNYSNPNTYTGLPSLVESPHQEYNTRSLQSNFDLGSTLPSQDLNATVQSSYGVLQRI